MSASLFAGATPADLWQAPVLFESLAVQAAYLAAVAGPLRPRRLAAPSGACVACFLSGMWILTLAFGSPLDYLADHVSVTAHMLQHTAEAFWAAPLLVLGLPPWLTRLWRPRPVAVAVAFNAVFLASHLPGPYDWTLADPVAHLCEHALILLTAMGLWWPLLAPGGALEGLRGKLVYLFANAYVMMPLAALLLLSTRPWYASGAAAHGLNPLGDQQWGAIVMMLGMFAAYAVVALGLMVGAAVPSEGPD